MAMDYKAELLGAVAAGGSRAKAAYEKTRQSMQQGQAEATRMALSNSVANNVPDEARAVVGGIIGQPYANHDAALQSQQASSEDYFNRLGASAGTYMDQAAALVPALERRNALKLEYEKAIREWEMMMNAQGRSGSGSGSDSEEDPWLDLQKSLGGQGNTKDYFLGLAGGDKYQARAAAIAAGMPEGIANSWYTKFDSGDEEYSYLVPQIASKYRSGTLTYDGKAVANRKQLKNALAQLAASLPGNQHKARAKVLKTVPKKPNKAGKNK